MCTTTLTVDLEWLAIQGMHQLEMKRGIPVEQQRWIHKGKQIHPFRTLKYNQIEKKSTIHLVLRLQNQSFAFGFGGIKDEESALIAMDTDFEVLSKMDNEKEKYQFRKERLRYYQSDKMKDLRLKNG